MEVSLLDHLTGQKKPIYVQLSVSESSTALLFFNSYQVLERIHYFVLIASRLLSLIFT